MAEGLAACPNTVLLPHLGSATVATRRAMAQRAATNAVAVLRGQMPPDAINPEAAAHGPRLGS